MKIYPTTSVSVRWDIEASVDLSSATARVLIDEIWYNLDWVTLSTPVGENFVRTAETIIGGVDSAALAKVLESQEPLVEVTVGTDVLVDSSTSRLDVQ